MLIYLGSALWDFGSTQAFTTGTLCIGIGTSADCSSSTTTINVISFQESTTQTKEQLQENELLVAETLSGGSTISKTSLRYPVKRFPSLLPTIIIDAQKSTVEKDDTSSSPSAYCDYCPSSAFGEIASHYSECYKCVQTNIGLRWQKQSYSCSDSPDITFYKDSGDTSSSVLSDFVDSLNGRQCPTTYIPIIYNKLNNGETIQVPETQTWTLFYIIDNNYQLPTICDIVDTETGQCIKISVGIVTVCSEGQFDPSLGLCVIQPESRTICPDGGRYDVSQAVCIWNPPLQAVCPTGSVYNVNTETCQYTPTQEYVCQTGFTYNSGTGKCEVYPSKTINCPGGYAYDVSTDQCVKYPDTRIFCPEGTTFNELEETCQYTPGEEYVCAIGFVYNSLTDKCEFTPSSEVVCSQGTYNTNTNRCEVNPPSETVCSKGILTDIGSGNYACIYTPESIAKCPTGTTYNFNTEKCEYTPETQGVCPTGTTYNSGTEKCEVELQITCVQGTYNADKKACVYEPNLQYLCVDGELTYENGEPVCKIVPEVINVCPQGSSYSEEEEKCIKNLDYIDDGITTIWDSISMYFMYSILGLGIALFLIGILMLLLV